MKKFYLLFLLMLLPLMASADDSGSCGENVTWTYVEESQKLIISGSGPMTDFRWYSSVPWRSYIDVIQTVEISEGVTSIGNWAFYQCEALTSVTIPNGITKIGSGAFEYCDALTSVAIPNSVTTIGNDAFGAGGLTSITIPSNVSSIGDGAFGRNPLTSIHVDEGNQFYMSEDNILFTKDKSTILVYSKGKTDESYTIPSSVTTIGIYAFYNTRLTSVIIPNSVITIGSDAFSLSHITSITIPSSVTSIGESAFSWNHLSSFNVEEGNLNYRASDGVLFDKDMSTLISYPLKKAESSYIIPNSVTTIADGAFTNCRNLSSVTFPNGLLSIEGYSFNHCSNLISLDIPNSVTSIGTRAFIGCDALNSVTIGSGVTSIGTLCFNGCDQLKNIYCYAVNPPEISHNLTNTPPQEELTLHVPAASLEAYKAADPWSKFGNIVPIDEKTDVDEITIKEIGKTTWCSEYDLDFTNVEGIKAYTATGYNNITKTIWLTRVMEVPAGTGILVKGDAGTYKIPHAEVQSAYANWFVGNLGDGIKIEETDGDKTNYYLSGKDGSFVSVNGSANIGKNKAYLQLPTSVFGGTRSIGINYDDEDGTTSIKDLTPALSEGEGAWYTLQGQRVAKPGKGLYIRNGKKVIVR